MTSNKRHSSPPTAKAISRFSNKLVQSAVTMLLTIFCAAPILAGIDYQKKADELMPVDCLLPGKVRKLGGQMTYVTQRRPVKTSGVDCEIRGGEYVLYDRASYQTALSIWQPLADGGDARAQNFVGEIYEKGLGVQPDYRVAAQWYQKAAEQKYTAAQVNLGQLYERGLGVERNMEQALAWYRASANIKGKLLKFVSYDYSDEKIAAMEQTISDNKNQTSKQNQRIQTLVAKLDKANSDKQNVKRKLAEQERALNGEKDVVTKQRQLLAQQQAEAAKIRDEMRLQLAAQKAELEVEKAKEKDSGFSLQKLAVRFDKRRLASLKSKLQKSEQAIEKLDQALSTNERKLASQELKLKQKDFELAQLSANYEDIQHELSESRNVIVSANNSSSSTTEKSSTKTEKMAAPTIAMIEPPMLATRGDDDFIVKTRSGLDQRTIIGQVTAASGLMDVFVNDKEVSVDKNGIFQHRVPLEGRQTKVEIIAIDTQGERAKLAFKLEKETLPQQNLYADGEAVPKSNKAKRKIPKIDFGNYYALVIGNSEYETLPDLNTTIADAEAMSRILANKYGFTVTTLKNATRYDILSALNNLRGKLTEDDNLLVYYAGHGELDEVNSRGHWLPVDAEDSSTANWISNIAITDLLNAMSVKKVLVVADSCYSGAMTRSTLARLDAGRSEKAWANWLKLVADKRSRLSFSSGGLAPVLDGGGGKHSIFAKALLDALENNETVIEGRQLHSQVAQAVSYAASAAQFEQAPQYAPIRFAGHESGDFLFVPK